MGSAFLFLVSFIVLCQGYNAAGQCTGDHEVFKCGSACDNICSKLDEQSETNCPIVNIRCNDACYCDDGYARDNNNKCVPIEDCPKTTSAKK